MFFQNKYISKLFRKIIHNYSHYISSLCTKNIPQNYSPKDSRKLFPKIIIQNYVLKLFLKIILQNCGSSKLLIKIII